MFCCFVVLYFELFDWQRLHEHSGPLTTSSLRSMTRRNLALRKTLPAQCVLTSGTWPWTLFHASLVTRLIMLSSSARTVRTLLCLRS